MERAKVVELVRETLRAVLAEAGKQPPQPLEEATPLVGKGAAVDSLGLVSLVSDLERRLEGDCGQSISLWDDSAVSSGQNPFATVGTLADHIVLLLGQR